MNVASDKSILTSPSNATVGEGSGRGSYKGANDRIGRWVMELMRR